MAFCDGVPKRAVATTIALAFAVCMLGSFAAAQVTVQPRVGDFRRLFLAAPEWLR